RVVSADSQKELRFEIMRIEPVHSFEPAQRHAVVLFQCIQAPELKTGLRKPRVEPGGLREEAMLLLRRGGNQAADIILYRIHTKLRTRLAEFLLAGRRLRRQRSQRLPGQMRLDSRQVLERAELGQVRSLPDSLQIQNAAGDAQRALGGRRTRSDRI